tara:strand:- start:162 stop:1016 length:855 start_codon:yes stop_codon:yes gene_type:complete
MAVSKQLLPVYDKPMIYYPLSVLMLAGIKDILIISTPIDLPRFEDLLGDGVKLGISIKYKEQPSPDGLAQAFILGEEFIGDDDVCLILGDNIFYGYGLTNLLQNSVKIVKDKNEALVFGYYVNDPERYGVVDFDENYNALSILEKPSNPKSNYAVVGLYFYPNSVVDIAKKVKPSSRGELEITSINQEYLNRKQLKVNVMGRGYAWLDTGTHESLIEASQFIQTIENRQSLKVACIEEISFELGYINKQQLKKIANTYKKNQYGQYLLKKLERGQIYDIQKNKN